MLASYFALMLCKTEQSDSTQIGLQPDADYLPIVVRIRDWILSQKTGLLEYLRSNAEASLVCKELPAGFFEHWLDRGKALILLDGLDEVVDEAQRRKVAEQIETFLHQYQYNPAVITSRPAGYRWDFFKLDEFPHYTLESFDDNQVATFIDHWYDSRLKNDSAQAERRKADLQKAFARNERIRLLAKNPLLLTIITLIHRYHADLPKRRCDLYEIAVKTLLTQWDIGKEIKLDNNTLHYLKQDDLLYLLKKLAYWIHSKGSVGETEGGTIIKKNDLIEQLRKEIQTRKKCEFDEAEEEAKRFIEFIRKRTGLLNEQGRERYAFVHKTFQEYLTAEEIYSRHKREDDTEIIWGQFRDHLHDQHWREVLLLLVSKLEGHQARKAIQTVLSANSEYEQWLHRDLLFAGWCLIEDPPELTIVAKDFVGEILDRLVGLEASNSSQIGSKIRCEARKILHCFGETSVEQDVWVKLQAQGDRIDRFRLLESQAVLGQEAEAIKLLLNLLDNQHSLVSLHAVEVLISIGNNSEKVMSCLLRLLNNEHDFIRLHAVTILVRSGNSTDSVVRRLLLLLDNEDSLIRIDATEILIKLGNINENVIEALLSLLKDQSSHVRCRAVIASAQLEKTSSEMIGILLSLLSDEDSYVRSNAVIALCQLENASPEMVSIVLSLLKDEDSYVRSNTVAALGKLGNANIEVVSNLRSLLEDEYFSVRFNAAAVLVQLGSANTAVISNLVSWLDYENASSVGSNAAAALAQLSKTSNTICPEVVQWLEQHPNHDGIGNAIDCLWSIVVE